MFRGTGFNKQSIISTYSSRYSRLVVCVQMWMCFVISVDREARKHTICIFDGAMMFVLSCDIKITCLAWYEGIVLFHIQLAFLIEDLFVNISISTPASSARLVMMLLICLLLKNNQHKNIIIYIQKKKKTNVRIDSNYIYPQLLVRSPTVFRCRTWFKV